MRPECRLLVAAFALLSSAHASASLITFEIEARIVSFGSAVGSFEADTGLSAATPFTWIGTVTFDTATPQFEGDGTFVSSYLFAQPVNSFHAMVGELELFADDFRIDLTRGAQCDRFGVAFGSYANLGFQSNYCPPAAQRWSDLTLDSLAASDMGFFGGTTFESVVTHNNWQILGNVNGIRRVPEPSTIALMCVALLAGLCVQRGTRSSASRAPR